MDKPSKEVPGNLRRGRPLPNAPPPPPPPPTTKTPVGDFTEPVCTFSTETALEGETARARTRRVPASEIFKNLSQIDHFASRRVCAHFPMLRGLSFFPFQAFAR